MVAVHVLVTGLVQGVGFRWSATNRAQALGLSGWVRNLGEDVELHLEGDEAAVEKMLAWVRVGPRWAQVEGVTVTPTDPQGFGTFQARY